MADKLGELDFSLHTLPEGEVGQEYSDEELSDTDAFLIECLAWGLLQVHDIKAPPVDVREILEHPLPIFKRLTLLELSLGLYDAAYRSCLDGSRLIVVDPARSRVTQRAGMARELYVAFCHSQRAIELHWPRREQPHAYSDFFARCLLMPAAWVQTACAETISLETLAARFDVPIQIMTERLGEVARRHPRSDLRESLTEALFSLKEPWRDRFLDFVANEFLEKPQTPPRCFP
ncbi:MAG TPA: ImmA/IrrE family metallo-endopeptidase [Thermoflexia bacterium]|nr:ImmA/IrrE family metallo-endopeptidase [Thermoflexia bacterium]